MGVTPLPLRDGQSLDCESGATSGLIWPPGISGEVAHIKVRYKPIDSEVRPLLEQPVVAVQDLGAPQGDLAFAAAVAAFAMVLRDSPWKGASNYAAIRQWAQPGLSRDPEGYRAQLLGGSQ